LLSRTRTCIDELHEFQGGGSAKSPEIESHQSIAAEKAVDRDNGRPRATSTFTFAV
jgi:hypothetical protein